MKWRKSQFSVKQLLLAVALFALAFGAFRVYRALTIELEPDAWVGWEMTAIERDLGKPRRIYEGDFSPDNELRPAPLAMTGQTLYYRTRRGHLYLWVCRGSRGWICYRSLWYRDGVRF